MSEIKQISPLLDNYDIGNVISEHHGVRCFPAMEKNSDSKYIIKTISIPASQTQLDALLLTGAYADEVSALSYFKELADSAAEEIEILNRLSKLDGFVSCDGYQAATMDDRVGYTVYMVTPYRRTLERHLQRQPLTQLGAVNLGLDICAALAVCRRAGYLYVDLKPSNIHMTEDGGYRIGDIGFIRLSSLKYASLPDKYHSAYTAPEITDAFATLNSTIDVYAAGLILYQTYNGGDLPVVDDSYGENGFSAPMYADYEMAEIILKACHPDPAQRWQDPIEMGQALVSYMQRNSVNDTPIVPPVVPAPEQIEESPTEQPGEVPPEDTLELIHAELAAPIEESKSVVPSGEVYGPISEDPERMEPESPVSEEAVQDEDDFENLSFLDDYAEDETSPENNLLDVSYDEVSEDISEILSQVDELTAHPVPDPVVAPDPIEVPMPEPIIPEPEEPAQSDETESSDPASLEDTIFAEPVQADDKEAAVAVLEENNEVHDLPAQEDAPAKSATINRWLRNIIIFLLIAAVAVAGYLYYKHIYLLNIDSVSVAGDEVNLVVMVDSKVDESLLSVVCSDSHGNQLSAPVLDGKASFANLTPDTAYNIKVLVDGFHRLTGDTAASYSTPAQTNVVQFNAVTGAENGSVILSFTVEGPETGTWSVAYSAEGEEERTVELLSHMATLNGLTVGKEYTFTLIPSEDMYVTGMTQLTFTASDLIYAQDLMILSCVDNKLTASWSAPAGVDVANWTVRCYDGKDYNETIIISDTTAVFEGIDPSNSFTVEVTAANMSVSQRAYVGENAITVSDFQVDTSNSTRLSLSWSSSQEIPEGGWILLYSIDGSETQGSVTTNTNSAVISPMVPGAIYTFTLQDTNGADVLTGHLGCQTPEAVDFSGYGVTPEHMTFQMCHTPEKKNWNRYDLSDSDFTNQFAVGDEISLLVKLSRRYAVYDDDITTLFVIRDENGKVVTYSHSTRTWDDMWYQYYCEMNVPKVPVNPGNYSLSIYFNGLYTQTVNFTIE